MCCADDCVEVSEQGAKGDDEDSTDWGDRCKFFHSLSGNMYLTVLVLIPVQSWFDKYDYLFLLISLLR